MTARDIQRRIVADNYRETFVLHNYTPAKWFECDIFQVTKAGYFVEYEIKVSRSDFKQDAQKARERVQLVGDSYQRVKGQTKHEQLSARSEIGPSRFYFVMPHDITCAVPEWAGLIAAHPGHHKTGPYSVRLEVMKKAPTLHKAKLNPDIEKHARGICYWRMHGLLLKTD